MGQKRVGELVPRDPRFGQIQCPPPPSLHTAGLTCHSFSGMSLGETRGRETSGPGVKRRDKGQGQAGGSLGENTRPRAKVPQRHIQRGRTQRFGGTEKGRRAG